MGSGLIAIVWLFGLIVGLLWILVPFLIMGTNRRLDRIIRQNALLLEHHGAGRDEGARSTAGEVVGAFKSLVTGKDD